MDIESIGDEDRSAGAGVQVIARAAAVLRALEGKPEGLSLAQIAREVGLARSTVQRIVAALAAEDFVSEAQPGRGVRIGAGLARIAASISSNLCFSAFRHVRRWASTPSSACCWNPRGWRSRMRVSPRRR